MITFWCGGTILNYTFKPGKGYRRNLSTHLGVFFTNKTKTKKFSLLEELLLQEVHKFQLFYSYNLSHDESKGSILGLRPTEMI